MKNLFIPIAFVLMTTCCVNGQTSFGVKGGINVSYMNIEFRESLVSFHSGVFSRIPLADEVFLQPELLYSVKGAKFPEYFYPYDMNFTFNYISMPILVGWRATDHLSIVAGPEISYLVDATLEFGLYVTEENDGISTWDVGLDLGVAYDINKRLGAELRFGYGLVNVVDLFFTDVNGQSLGGLNEGKNRAIQLSMSCEL